ncbi:MAG: hypothetical protein CMM55_11290 [Rhodospirillaceae bacterium]|nr:hypothetical protein [Rhodospirillaceae bacterium]
MYAGIYAALLTVVDVYIKKDAVLGLCDALFLPFGWSLVAEEKEDNANVVKFFKWSILLHIAADWLGIQRVIPLPLC